MRDVTRLHGSVLNLKAIMASLVLVIISLALLWMSEQLTPLSLMWFGKVVPSFAAVVGTSGVFAVVYEVFVRHQQTKYILEALDLRESLIRAGLDDLSTDYMDYDYASQIKNAKDIVIFALYAQTWTGRYSVDLRRQLEMPGRSLTLCVPALDNPFLQPLAVHFGYTLEKMQQRIADTVMLCVQGAVRGEIEKSSVVRVLAHHSRPSYSLYKFDDRLLVGTYYASKARRRAPMFEFINVPGSMFEEFAADLSLVCDKESEVWFDSGKRINMLEGRLGKFVPSLIKSAAIAAGVEGKDA